MQHFFSVFFMLAFSSLFAQQGGALRPSVTEKSDAASYRCYNAPLLDSVEITAFIPGTTDTLRGKSDSTGEVVIKHVTEGIYTVRANVPGYVPAELKGVIIKEIKTTYLCFEMTRIIPDKKGKKKKKTDK